QPGRSDGRRNLWLHCESLGSEPLAQRSTDPGQRPQSTFGDRWSWYYTFAVCSLRISSSSMLNRWRSGLSALSSSSSASAFSNVSCETSLVLNRLRKLRLTSDSVSKGYSWASQQKQTASKQQSRYLNSIAPAPSCKAEVLLVASPVLKTESRRSCQDEFSL